MNRPLFHLDVYMQAPSFSKCTPFNAVKEIEPFHLKPRPRLLHFALST